MSSAVAPGVMVVEIWVPDAVPAVLAKLAADANAFCRTAAAGYLWQGRPLRFHAQAATPRAPGCVRGVTVFDENVDDEWLAMWLVWRLCEVDGVVGAADGVAAVEDEDGYFFLAEVADALPEWMDRGVDTTHRVFLHRGRMLAIPPPGTPGVEAGACLREVSTSHLGAAHARRWAAACALPASVTSMLCGGRLSGYPARAMGCMHRTRALLTEPVARLLSRVPALAPVAYRGFASREEGPPSLATAHLAKHFAPAPPPAPAPPLVPMMITLPRHAYAHLTHLPFHAPKRFATAYPHLAGPAAAAHPDHAAFVLGCQLAVGMEVALQRGDDVKALARGLAAAAAGAGTPALPSLDEVRSSADFQSFLQLLRGGGFFAACASPADTEARTQLALQHFVKEAFPKLAGSSGSTASATAPPAGSCRRSVWSVTPDDVDAALAGGTALTSTLIGKLMLDDPHVADLTAGVYGLPRSSVAGPGDGDGVPCPYPWPPDADASGASDTAWMHINAETVLTGAEGGAGGAGAGGAADRAHGNSKDMEELLGVKAAMERFLSATSGLLGVEGHVRKGDDAPDPPDADGSDADSGSSDASGDSDGEEGDREGGMDAMRPPSPRTAEALLAADAAAGELIARFARARGPDAPPTYDDVLAICRAVDPDLTQRSLAWIAQAQHAFAGAAADWKWQPLSPAAIAAGVHGWEHDDAADAAVNPSLQAPAPRAVGAEEPTLSDVMAAMDAQIAALLPPDAGDGDAVTTAEAAASDPGATAALLGNFARAVEAQGSGAGPATTLLQGPGVGVALPGVWGAMTAGAGGGAGAGVAAVGGEGE